MHIAVTGGVGQIGTETLVSIDRARALIGFEPAHSISQHF